MLEAKEKAMVPAHSGAGMVLLSVGMRAFWQT
jgi:hypothetical protein